MLPIKTLSLACTLSTLTLLSACSHTGTAEDDNSPELNVWSEPMDCFSGGNVIDGEKIEGTICATRDYGYHGGKAPEIYFIPADDKQKTQQTNAVTNGSTGQWQGKQVALKCDDTIGSDYKTVVKRVCRVSINNQTLMSANVHYAKSHKDID